MKPSKLTDLAFEYVAAREKFEAYMVIDQENSYEALALALICDGCRTTDDVFEEVSFLSDDYVAQEAINCINDAIARRSPFRRAKDGTLYLLLQDSDSEPSAMDLRPAPPAA